MVEKSLDDAEHKPLDDTLRRGEAFFHSLSACCPVGIFATDTEGRCTYTNPRCQSICGFTLEESLGESWGHFIHPEERELVMEQWLARVRSGGEFQSEIRCQTPQGVTRWVQVRSHSLFNEHSQLMGYVSTVEDMADSLADSVAARKQAEEQLRLSEERFRVALQSVPLVLAHMDRDLRFTWVANVPSEFAPEAVLGKTDAEILPPEVAEPFMRLKRSVLESGIGCRQEVWVEVGEQKRAYDMALEPLRDTTGMIIGLTEVALDITDRKRSEQALRESEQRLKLAQGVAKVGTWEWNVLTNEVAWSEGIWMLLGLAPDCEELGVKPWEDFIHPDDRERTWRNVEAVFAQGQDYDDEFRIVRHDGTVGWLASKGRVIRGADGQIERFVGVNFDISDRKQAEAALEANLAQLEAVISSMTEGLIVANPQGHILTFNPAALTLHGFQSIDEVRQPVGFFANLFEIRELDGQLVSITDWPISRALAGETFSGWRLRLHRTDTGKCWVAQYGGTPVRNKAGEVILAIIVISDVTAQYEAEEALRESERRYRSIFDTATVSIWEQDFSAVKLLIDELKAQGITDIQAYLNEHPEVVHQAIEMVRVIDVNEQSLSVFQAQSKEELLASLSRIFVPETTSVFQDEMIAIANGKRYFSSEAQLRTLQGERTDVLLAISFPEPETLFNSVLVCLMDMTERKRAEEEREQLLVREQTARAQAEAANRTKDEFLSILSHELRTPLNPILGWAKLLRTGKLNEVKTADALETIERNALLQAQLIEDLLDVSRILQGKLSLNVSPVNLTYTITAAIETVRLAAEAKLIQIETVFAPDVEQTLGDANRIQQVIWNLLSNAIKFTPQGGRVTVQLQRVSSYVQIQVSDTGKGINSDFLPYVFDSFRQADSSTSRASGGLGLGLAISRHIVELHGGTILAQSPGEGQGATFVVSLPLIQTKVQTSNNGKPSEASPDLTGIRVLVVEDEADTRELIAFILEQYGAVVSAVASAIEALQTLQRSQPDILLSDIGMPGMDGYWLMRQIRTLEAEQGGLIPAIALTAYAGEFDQKQALLSGFQRHISKPIEPAELAVAIASLIG